LCDCHRWCERRRKAEVGRGDTPLMIYTLMTMTCQSPFSGEPKNKVAVRLVVKALFETIRHVRATLLVSVAMYVMKS
jgi:hypothetical protein